MGELLPDGYYTPNAGPLPGRLTITWEHPHWRLANATESAYVYPPGPRARILIEGEVELVRRCSVAVQQVAREIKADEEDY